MYQSPLSFSPYAARTVEWRDEETGAEAFVCLAETLRGPALGGTRLHAYAKAEHAVAEAEQLATAMSYKAALAGLRLGGGKAVINAEATKWSERERAAFFTQFGQFIDSFKGLYLTTEDSGTTAEDMASIKRSTNYVVGLPEGMGGSGSPSPYTALGLLRAMRACAKKAFGKESLSGKIVAVQGVGSVGSELVKLLASEGAEVVCADLVEERAQAMKKKFGAKIVAPEEIFSVPCDIFAPCALGPVLNGKTLGKLQASIVCGAANNQLASMEIGEKLHAQGVLYAPDFLVNAGGLIAVSAEPVVSGKPFDRAAVLVGVEKIGERMAELLRFSEESMLSPAMAATVLAEQRLEARP